MATSYIMILPMVILVYTFMHNNVAFGKNQLLNEYEEYAAKFKGTLKTMKWRGGDLVDCVDIYKQPSMNHPLLKNHVIQLEHDSFPSDSLIKRNLSRSNLMDIPENKRCPNGSIPIRRPFKDELVRATFSPSRQNNSNIVNELPNVGHKYAVLAQPSNGPLIISVSASISVWKPTTEHTTFSLSQVWAIYTSENVVQESLEAGWMVYPSKFGDQEPRFFIYFINDKNRTGCYNMECLGFVQVSPSICLGCNISPPSIYNGSQFSVDIAISLNPFTKAWRIRYENELVGYYDGVLFPRLSQGGATHVEWGGEVSQQPQSTQPTPNQIGSGHFPEEGRRKAAFFQNPLYEEVNWRVYTPVNDQLIKVVSHPLCYRVSRIFSEGVDKPYLYYGGPGGNAPGCNI